MQFKSTWTFADVLAHALSLSFIVMGLVALGAGDMRVEETRHIRVPMDIVGSDRVSLGVLLLAAGYVFQRWLFRRRHHRLRWAIEIQVLALFMVAGYTAYRVGVSF